MDHAVTPHPTLVRIYHDTDRTAKDASGLIDISAANMKSFLPKLQRRPWYNRVQILSDLHLEIGQQYASFTFPVTAPYLLLAGDIGRLIDYDSYLAFLQAQTLRFEAVFLVLGNHEFYDMAYHDALNTARRLADEPCLAQRLILLDNTRWDSPKSSLSILGCTLWSFIPDEKASIVQSTVSDFKKITDWTVATHNRVHAQEAAWLRNEVANLMTNKNKPQKRNILVATHHAPCIQGTSRPEHIRNPWSSAFATDILTSGDWGHVKTWVFGHTHYSTDIMLRGVRVVANQRGYVIPMQSDPNWIKKHGSNYFDPGKMIVN